MDTLPGLATLRLPVVEAVVAHRPSCWSTASVLPVGHRFMMNDPGVQAVIRRTLFAISA